MSTAIDTIKSCAYCGNWHSGMCPRIESIEYHRDGTVAKVVLRPLGGAVAPQVEDNHDD